MSFKYAIKEMLMFRNNDKRVEVDLLKKREIATKMLIDVIIYLFL